MYILKIAFQNIVRSKGRNILIGIIIFVISVSLCIGLSIRQSASSARESALSDMTITAQISVDRSKMMNDAMNQDNKTYGGSPQFDKSSFKGFSDSLSVDEMTKYAEADCVENFYYTISTSLNAVGDLSAVSDTETESTSATEATSSTQSENQNQNQANSGNQFNGDMNQPDNMMGGKMDAGGMMGNGDFSLVGYSDDSAMTDFIDGTSSITDGSVFEQGTDKYDCIISEELATYNSLSVGDSITLSNPNDDDEQYTLSIVGIYKSNDSSSEDMMGKMFSFSDPSNKIYMSYTALKDIVDKSQTAAENSSDESQSVFSQTNGTYVFDTVEDYESFQTQVYDMGLSDDYTVSSEDISRYEQSLVPLETLSTIAGYFLIVIILIGTLILIILNIFSIRERKYEIGVLTAIGMKKHKVAFQFISEMLIVTLFAVIIGGAVGAVSSVPVTNTLLESQIESQQQTNNDRDMAFGRGFDNRMNEPQMQSPDNNSNLGNASSNDAFLSNYVDDINSSVNITVLLELLGICILISILASLVSVTTIMRYDPLKILSNRD